MPDREKVFDALRNCVTVPKCRDCPWEECEQFECKKVSVPVNLLLDALKLLKEQEPKTVIKDIYGNAYCPHCSTERTVEMMAMKLHVGTKFCPYCGKAVKWNGCEN